MAHIRYAQFGALASTTCGSSAFGSSTIAMNHTNYSRGRGRGKLHMLWSGCRRGAQVDDRGWHRALVCYHIHPVTFPRSDPSSSRWGVAGRSHAASPRRPGSTREGSLNHQRGWRSPPPPRIVSDLPRSPVILPQTPDFSRYSRCPHSTGAYSADPDSGSSPGGRD